MSDNNDAGDKSELASPHKLEKARKEGQIPRAKEFVSTATLLAVIAYYLINLNEFKLAMMSLYHTALSFDSVSLRNVENTTELFGHALFLMVQLFFPLMLIQIITAIVSSSLLGGWVMNLKLLQPKLEKISPIKGLKRIFSHQSLVELFKNIIKVSLFFALLYEVVHSQLDTISHLIRAPFDSVLIMIRHIALEYLGWLLLIVILFGIFDFPYQKYLFGKEMKMTKQEVKDEHKEKEGKPEIKARIRQIQMRMAKQSANQRMPEASVVITNPNEFAVALTYDLAKAEAPFVIAKGKDELAQYIKHLASNHQISIVSSPALARAIYHTTQIDQMIPNQLFMAVAHILTYVEQLRSWKRGERSSPDPLPKFQIPREWSDPPESEVNERR
ncbi:flagellar biosynthesis protein FlhB [Vibrio astriarenae]